MANEEHLQRLKQDVSAWNESRQKHSAIRIDLNGADLSRVNLSGAFLDGADLREADLNMACLLWAHLGADFTKARLTGAFLAGAHLKRAHLVGADIREAHLKGADLRRADLSQANLNQADLRGANLSQANLSQANLNGADLTGARFWETILGDTDLTLAKDLDLCLHLGPSTIDHRTLIKSGKLPLAFLRGCGLPDTLINYLPSLFNEHIQFYSCFISYSHQDEAFAQRLHADLQNKGVRCWYAAEDMKIGDRIRDTIDQQIRLRDKLLVVLSSTSHRKRVG